MGATIEIGVENTFPMPRIRAPQSYANIYGVNSGSRGLVWHLPCSSLSDPDDDSI